MKSGIKYLMLCIFLQACISGGTHGVIASYKFPVSKYELEKVINDVIYNTETIKPDYRKDHYNDGVNYLKIVIKKDTSSYKYIFRYLGGKKDWDVSSQSAIFICYIYDGKGNGGSIGNGKFENTPIEIQKDMINLFEKELVTKVNNKLKK